MIERTYPQSRQKWLGSGWVRSVHPWLVVLFVGSAAMGAWLLIGPALAHGRYYKVGFNRSTFEYTRPILLLFIPLSIGLGAVRPMLAHVLARHASVPPSWYAALVTLGARALGVAFNFLLLMTLYRFGPSVRRGYGQIWAGALAGAVLWEASKALFGIYVRSLSSYKMLYGSVGSVIAVLLWLYVSGTIFALGAEINFVLDARRERRRG